MLTVVIVVVAFLVLALVLTELQGKPLPRKEVELPTWQSTIDPNTESTLTRVKHSHIQKGEKDKFYLDYLKTPLWATKRLGAIRRANFKCEMCSTPVGIDTAHCHHLTYKHLGGEEPDELACLCRYCHLQVHLYHGNNAINYPLLTAKQRSAII